MESDLSAVWKVWLVWPSFLVTGWCRMLETGTVELRVKKRRLAKLKGISVLDPLWGEIYGASGTKTSCRSRRLPSLYKMYHLTLSEMHCKHAEKVSICTIDRLITEKNEGRIGLHIFAIFHFFHFFCIQARPNFSQASSRIAFVYQSFCFRTIADRLYYGLGLGFIFPLTVMLCTATLSLYERQLDKTRETPYYDSITTGGLKKIWTGYIKENCLSK